MATPSTPAFVKTPDADASAKSAVRTADAVQKTQKGFPRWIFFALIGLVVVAAAVAGLLFLRHRNKAQHGKGASARSLSTNEADAKAVPPAPTVELPLDPFVVNLADTGGHSYARIGLTLQMDAPPATGGKGEKKEEAAAEGAGPRDMVRDTIIGVLNQEQSANLLAPGGKEHLKQTIRAAVAARDPQVKIADIYFTEFLIQQ